MLKAVRLHNKILGNFLSAYVCLNEEKKNFRGITIDCF